MLIFSVEVNFMLPSQFEGDVVTDRVEEYDRVLTHQPPEEGIDGVLPRVVGKVIVVQPRGRLPEVGHRPGEGHLAVAGKATTSALQSRHKS